MSNTRDKQFDRRENLKNAFPKKVRTEGEAYEFGITVRDWARGFPYIYFNGKNIFSENEARDLRNPDIPEESKKEIIERVIASNLENRVDERIIDHIKNFAHQGGFLNISQSATGTSLFMNFSIGSINHPVEHTRKHDFIINTNGSITYIERCNIGSLARVASSDVPLIPSEQADKHHAIIVARSKIYIDKFGELRHKLLSDEIIQTNKIIQENGEVTAVFNHDDAELVTERYHDSIESINEELDNSTSLQILHNQRKQLEEAFSHNLAILALQRADALKQSPHHSDWIYLQAELENLIAVIEAQSSLALNHAISKANEKAEAEYQGYMQQVEQSSATHFSRELIPDRTASTLTIRSIHGLYPNAIQADNVMHNPLFTSVKEIPAAIIQRADNQEFDEACMELAGAIEEAEETGEKNQLAAAAKNALALAELYKKNNKVTQEELPKLTTWLRGMAELVDKPNDRVIYKNHLKNTKEAMNIGNQYQWAKILGGIMLAIAGIAVIALATLALISTFAASSPVSIPALAAGSALTALGVSLLGSQIAAGVILGAGAVLGAGSLAGGSFFAHHSRKGEIESHGSKLAKAVDDYRYRI
jgi:hypothetical protein